MGRPSVAKQKLIEASQELFWQRGYENVSVDDLCQHAGVNKGSFYYFFKTKKELALQSNEQRWQSIQQMQLVDPQVGDPLAQIPAYFQEVIKLQETQSRTRGDQIRGCPFGIMGAELSSIEPEITEQVQRVFEGHIRFIAHNLQLAHQIGMIGPGDFDAIAREIFTMWQGALLLARVYNDPAALQQTLQNTRGRLASLRAKES